jgi:hypothetical protein
MPSVISSLFKNTRKKSKTKSKSKSKSNSFTRRRNTLARTFLSNITKTIKRRKILDNLRKKSSARKIQKSFKIALEKELDADVCSICLSKMLFKTLTTTLPCGHEFHTKCIKPVITNDYNARCPLCRAPIATATATATAIARVINQTNIGSRHSIYRGSRNQHRTRQLRHVNIASLHDEWTRLSRAATNARIKWHDQRIKALAVRERANRANFFNRSRLLRIAEREEQLETTYLEDKNRSIRARSLFERRHSHILSQIIANSRNSINSINSINSNSNVNNLDAG